MSKYKINHDRSGCIGCGTCSALCSENWEMGEDGLANVKKTELDDSEFGSNMEAAKNCPVNVIHILDEEGKSLI